MANPNAASAPTTVTPAPVNGATPATDAPVKRKQAPREVPMIGISASKAEYDELKAGLAKLMTGLAGIQMDVPLGPFVLACALKTIRANK